MCVILETLLVLQSYSTDLAPELVLLGGALLTDSTKERHKEIHMFPAKPNATNTTLSWIKILITPKEMP
jgi:hypothetical protein